jgi:hypothetical protein
MGFGAGLLTGFSRGWILSKIFFNRGVGSGSLNIVLIGCCKVGSGIRLITI